MAQYLLSVMQPTGGPLPPDDLEPIMRDLNALNDELRAAGVVGLRRRPARAPTRRPSCARRTARC